MPTMNNNASSDDVGVTLSWVRALPLKMQSVLFSGLRGPDTAHCPQLKRLVRWLRPATQINADPSSDYMRDESLPTWDDIQKELEFTSQHYFQHLACALEIIGYKHPNELVRGDALHIYMRMSELMHMNHETEGQLDTRLGP